MTSTATCPRWRPCWRRSRRSRSTGSCAAATSSRGRSRASASTSSCGLDAVFVRGNADRESPRAPAGTWEWITANLDPQSVAFLDDLPQAVSLGGVLYCHGSPRDDDEILTRVSSDERFRAALAGVEERVVVGGHTHVQFERVVDGIRFVNAGSVGMPYEGKQGAFWALLDGEERRSPAHAVRRRRGCGRDSDERLPRARIRSPGCCSTRRTRTRCRRTSRALPRSFVREARRPVGRRRDRIRPIIERLAVEHADARIALDFRNPLELLVSVMLSAQTTDVNVNRVTERLFEKYRRPEDYLAVPQEELELDVYATGFFRQKAKSIRGTMRVLLEEFDGEVPRTIEELLRLPGVARKTANVVAAELGNAAGSRRRHARAPALAAARADEAGGPGQDRARSDEARPARGLGPVPAPADLARPPDLRRAPPLCEECVLNDLCPSARVWTVLGPGGRIAAPPT